jgi:hypothetical protein
MNSGSDLDNSIFDLLGLSEDLSLALSLQIEHDRRKAEQEQGSQTRTQIWNLPPARTPTLSPVCGIG